MAADRGYDSDATRGRSLDEDVMPQIPNHPRRNASWDLRAPAHRERNRAARWVGRLKRFRRVATRYHKPAVTLPGFVPAAVTVTRLT